MTLTDDILHNLGYEEIYANILQRFYGRANMLCKVPLGSKVKCKFTGFKGHVSTVVVLLGAAPRCAVQPSVDKKGELPEIKWFDDINLVVVGNGYKAVQQPSQADIQFPLGSKAKCKVTNLEGIVTSVNFSLNGCRSYHLQPPVDKDGKIVEGYYINESNLTLLEKPKEEHPVAVKTGGPISSRPPMYFA